MRTIKKLVNRSPKAPSNSQSQQTTASSRSNEPAIQPSEAPALLSFPDGVHVLHDRRDAAIDICFIHGLTGNRESTWTAQGQTAPWPKTLLPPKLETARILTYGYDADIMRKSVAGANRLIDHATNLLTDLTTDRLCSNASTRPLIFIAHSLGGLVCKEAILLSRNNPEAHLRGLFEFVKGIIFMGTPHKGSWMSDWARIPATALGFVKSNNKSLLTILQTNDQFLESIQVRFAAMVRELRENGRRIELTCFFEELPLRVVGKVVSKDSATFEGYNSISIHGNHSDMVKFGSAEDNGFKRLLGELQRWTSSDNVPRGHQNSANPVVRPLMQGSNSQFMVPYNENPDFIGRTGVLEQVKQQFGYSQPPAAGPPRSRVSLYGLGGVGKTQIALAYAYWLRKTQPEISVFWVHASNAQRFRQAYTSIAQKYSIPGLGHPDVNVLAVVKEWLEENDRGQWLMVIDNADDTGLFFQTQPDGDSTVQEDSSLGRYIPECRHGQVLITTRSKQAGLKLAQGKAPIAVEKMDQSEAEQLVLSMLKGAEVSPQPEEILLLSSRLEYLPLVLAQAAAFIQENSISVGDYIQLLDGSNDSSVDLLSHPFETVGRDLDTPRAVTTTWIISFEQIQRQDALASDVLSFISLLDRQAIPKEFVTHYCNEERPNDSRPIGPADITKALGTLKAFCFVSEAKDQSLDLHRLVQLVTRMWLHRKNTIRQFAENALKTFYKEISKL
ncbi:hypothetical protein VSDG_07735 [Cytospora chrysosperma]|uniref:DUF676 domain-containing protein n=1 Tax=Cytospora chrysosperma TaxID=252740 RepID=A0A423VJ35_CYTCH|nr:hypothetical protein VSDG_07735 [Valsa sordida]